MVRRNFTREFKLSILDELSSGKTAAQVCREHNIGSNLLSTWRKDYETDPNKAFSGTRNIWRSN